MHEKFLIRMLTWEEEKDFPTLIKSFYSDRIKEFLDLYFFAKAHEILIDIPEEDKYHSKFDGHQAFINDIGINFGGYESIPSLDIYVDVI